MLRLIVSRQFLAVSIAALWAAGMLAFAISQETPVAAVRGRIKAEDTGKPIASARVVLVREGKAPGDEWTSKSMRTDKNGDYRFSNVPAGDYKIEAYAKVHSIEPSDITVREGKVEQVDLELKPGDPYFNLYTHPQLFMTKETPEIEFDGFSNANYVNVKVYKIAANALLSAQGRPIRELLSAGYGDYVDQDSFKLAASPTVESAETMTVSIKEHDSEGVFHQKVTLGKRPAGAYVIETSMDSQNGPMKKRGIISVSDIGIVTKESGQDMLAYAVRPDTGAPVPKVQVTVFEADDTVGSGETGIDGVWQGRLTSRKGATVSGDTGDEGDSGDDGDQGDAPGQENRIILGRLGDSIALLTSYSYEPRATDLSIYAYTDRPIYRPGQEVHFKGIVRRFAGDFYQLPPQGKAKVEIRDKRETLVYSAELPLNRYGTFHGDFALPEYAATGGYDVTYTFGGYHRTVSFAVAEYRKPEFQVTVEMPKKRCVRGEKIKAKIKANYFFGAPVVGAKVHYSISRSDYWFWPNEEESDLYGEGFDGEGMGGGDYGAPTMEGDVRTGPDGMAEVEFIAYWDQPKDAYYVTDQQFTVNANIMDVNGGVQASGDGSIIATQGDFNLTVTPESYVAEPGKNVRVTVAAQDYDSKPQAGAEMDVTANLINWDEDSREEVTVEVARQTIKMGSDGRAVFTFRPAKAGSYSIRVRCRDSHGDDIRSSGDVWVEGEGYFEGGHTKGHLQVMLDRKSYNPGDTAKLMINSRGTGASALVTVEGRRLYSQRIVKLDKPSVIVEIPVLREYKPNFYVSVCYVKDKHLAQRDVGAKVTLNEETINLSVVPDKQKYAPGEMATYLIKAIDGAGKPVQADVSLGVVDEAIYELQEDDTTPIRDFFYSRRPNSVSTRYSFPETYLSGDKAGFTGVVRKDFQDTAFWQASVTTDRTGQARVRVKLPDNLTTWRATARACSLDTAVGETVSKVICTKNLLVRLETPRFFIQGDRVQISAIVHNYTSGDQDTQVILRARGLGVEGDAMQRVTVRKDGMEQVRWWVTAGSPGKVQITAYAVGRPDQDAMQLTIPIRPRGQRQVSSTMGTVTGSSGVVRVNIRGDAVDGASEIRIRLSPSIASSLIGGLDYLAEYPYGCTEQTMSCFLPDVIIARTLRSLNVPYPSLEKRLPKMVGSGLNRLYDFQNKDGGWGWCEYGSEDLWMTSYVVYGLLTARSAGYAVNEQVLSRGVSQMASEIGHLKAETPKLPYAVYVAALAGQRDAASYGLGLIKRTENHSSHDMALIALAYAAFGDSQSAQAAMQDLWSRAKTAPNEVYWDDTPFWRAHLYGYWFDMTQAETNAFALMAAQKITPNDTRIPLIVRWLMDQRKFNCWSSTRDTAMVIYAVSDYIARTKELTPDYTVAVSQDGRQIASEKMGGSSVFSPEKVITIGPADVRKGWSEFRFDKRGTGTLYYTVEVVQYIPRQGASQVVTGSGIKVSREYRKFISRWNENLRYNELQPSDSTQTRFDAGDVLQVRLVVNSPKDYHHVLVEDYMPAGCESFDRGRIDPDEWSYWWADVDVRDERVSFYVDTLRKGRNVLEYQVRASVPGTYHAPGTLVQGMYEPSVYALGAEDEFGIRE